LKRRSFLQSAAAASLTSLFPWRTLQASTLPRSFDPAGDPLFALKDVTSRAGISFRHNSGAYGGKLLPETLGSGCAFLDYDGD